MGKELWLEIVPLRLLTFQEVGLPDNAKDRDIRGRIYVPFT